MLNRIVKRIELESRIAFPIKRKSPDFMIIGTQKGGTTSLYDYLIQHPDVQSTFRKEIHFFDNNYDKGMKWYKSFFPLSSKKGITGEATPFYLFHPLVPNRIKKDIGDIKFIVLLRNPIERAFSHYKMEKRRGYEKLSFRKALDVEEDRLSKSYKKVIDGQTIVDYQTFSYKERGKYAEQLKRWFEIFPRENFLILNSENLFNKPNEIYQQVESFLGLDPFSEVNFEKLNADKTKQTMDPSISTYLSEYFRGHNKELFSLIGKDFKWQ